MKKIKALLKNIKIVKLNTGKFAIRKGFIFYKFYVENHTYPNSIKWVKDIKKCWITSSFNVIAKEYDRAFIDDGEIVNFIREKIKPIGPTHISPIHTSAGKEKYQKIIKCTECMTIGELHGYTSQFGPCPYCGNGDYEELVGRWDGNKWQIK